MTSDVIIGFLTGSILTEVVRESLRLFTKGIEYKKELAKFTYERKLQLAERAMAFYYTYYERVMEVKKSYEIYIKLLDEYKTEDTEIVQNLIDHNIKSLSELNGDKYIDINSIFLYFDLDHDNYWGEKENGMLTEARVEAAIMEDQIHNWLELFRKHANNTDKSADYWIKATELFPEFIDILQHVITLLNKNQESMRRTFNLIRDQTKKY